MAGWNRKPWRNRASYSSIKERATELDRIIPEDHFGAGFAFRFGSPEEEMVSRQKDLLSKRLKKIRANLWRSATKTTSWNYPTSS